MGYVEQALGANEKIIVHVRKHPITLLWPLCYNALLLVFVMALANRVEQTEPEFFAPVLSLGVLPVCFFIIKTLAWGNEEYFVTNRRVIQSSGIINKRMIDSSLEKVNDVVLSQSWIGRLLNYGDVEILTASEIGVNNLLMISSPVRFKTELINQKEILGANEGYRGPTAPGGIEELFQSLEQLRREGILTEAEFIAKKKQLLARM